MGSVDLQFYRAAFGDYVCKEGVFEHLNENILHNSCKAELLRSLLVYS